MVDVPPFVLSSVSEFSDLREFYVKLAGEFSVLVYCIDGSRLMDFLDITRATQTHLGSDTRFRDNRNGI